MGAITAVMLIGSPHPNRGGNRPYAQIHLEESDRPALTLHWNTRSPKGEEVFKKFTMTPTLENLLDDSVLMVAYAICRQSAVFGKVNRLAKNAPLDTNRLEMYSSFTPKGRSSLYECVKKLDDLPKVTWCIFDGSLMKRSIAHLASYRFECEVTRSAFVHEYSNWTGKWEVKGSLS